MSNIRWIKIYLDSLGNIIDFNRNQITDKYEYGTDGNIYRLSISTGIEDTRGDKE